MDEACPHTIDHGTPHRTSLADRDRIAWLGRIGLDRLLTRGNSFGRLVVYGMGLARLEITCAHAENYRTSRNLGHTRMVITRLYSECIFRRWDDRDRIHDGIRRSVQSHILVVARNLGSFDLVSLLWIQLSIQISTFRVAQRFRFMDGQLAFRIDRDFHRSRTRLS